MSSQPSQPTTANLGLIRTYWRAAAGVIVLTLISVLLASVEPLLQKYFFDTLAGAVPHGWTAQKLITALLAGMISLVVLSEAVAFFSNYLTWRLRLRDNYRLLDAVVSHIYNLSLSFHQQQTIDSLRTRMDKAVNGFCQVMFDVCFSILPSVLYLGTTIFFMVHLSPRLSVVALCFAPLPAIIGFFSGRIASEREKVLMKRWIAIFGRFHETLSLVKTVKSFVMEEGERGKFVGEVQQANALVARGIRVDSLFGSAKNMSMACGRLAVLGYGALLVLQGEATIGTLVAFLTCVGGLSAPVIGLAGVYEAFRKGRIYMGMLREILTTPQQVADMPNARELTTVEGRVSFQDVRFGYQAEREILKGVDFDVPAGATVALVGPAAPVKQQSSTCSTGSTTRKRAR
jgi:ATP-binding cassette subfamily B protein